MIDTPIKIARIQERMEALERWQVAQNGQLKELSVKLDNLSEKVDSKILGLHDRVNGVNKWLFGVLSSSLAGLTLLVLNLIIGKP